MKRAAFCRQQGFKWLLEIRFDPFPASLKTWNAMTAQKQDSILYYTELNLNRPWSPAVCWDIENFYETDKRWRVSPPSTVWNTVTVNNRVYYQDEVNYYWYGVIRYMKDHRKSLGGTPADTIDEALRSIHRYRGLLWGLTNIEGRQKWALAGYFGDLSLARGTNLAMYTPNDEQLPEILQAHVGSNSDSDQDANLNENGIAH